MILSRRLILLAAILVTGAALLFMPLPMELQFTLAGRTIENAGHTPLFGVITLGMLSVLRSDFRLSGVRLYGAALLLGAGGGLFSEVIQIPLHRDADWVDVYADIVGVVAAMAVFACFDRTLRLSRAGRWSAAVVALICVVIWTTPLARVGYKYWQRNSSFPVLADFTTARDEYWTVGHGVRRGVVDGALEVQFVSQPFPGLRLMEPYPDWNGFSALVIEVQNPDDQPLKLGLRVHDRRHNNAFEDRFNREYELAAGERRTLRIDLADIRAAPRGRRLDLGHIADISLFKTDEQGSRRLRLYYLLLD
jgi:VanZ family protein